MGQKQSNEWLASEAEKSADQKRQKLAAAAKSQERAKAIEEQAKTIKKTAQTVEAFP